MDDLVRSVEIGNSKAVYEVFKSRWGGRIGHGRCGRRGWDGWRGKRGSRRG